MKYTFRSWAINTQSSEGHGFLGNGWWFFGNSPRIPFHLRGCSIALFGTRKEARQALKYERKKAYPVFPKTKVSRVEVTVKEIMEYGASKLLEINICLDCNHLYERKNRPYKCGHPEGKEIGEVDPYLPIPSGCPLPDAKEEMEEHCEECGAKLIHTDLVRCPKCTAELFEGIIYE